jgi:hypothetical protein
MGNCLFCFASAIVASHYCINASQRGLRDWHNLHHSRLQYLKRRSCFMRSYIDYICVTSLTPFESKKFCCDVS